MITLDDIRRFATAFPEVEESAHFRQPAFKVRGKAFAGGEKGEATAVFSISQEEAAAAVPPSTRRSGATPPRGASSASESTSPRSRGRVSRNSSSTHGATRPPNGWWPRTTPAEGQAAKCVWLPRESENGGGFGYRYRWSQASPASSWRRRLTRCECGRYGRCRAVRRRVLAWAFGRSPVAYSVTMAWLARTAARCHEPGRRPAAERASA